MNNIQMLAEANTQRCTVKQWLNRSPHSNSKDPIALTESATDTCAFPFFLCP